MSGNDNIAGYGIAIVLPALSVNGKTKTDTYHFE